MTEMKGDDDTDHLSPYENGTAPTEAETLDDNKSALSCSRPSSARSDASTRVKFRLYTTDSWDKQLQKEEEKRKKEARTGGIAEAHLVDGELKFDDDEEEAKKESNPKLKEGELLPPDLADVFRTDYYGKPLEEIDRFIKDKTFVTIAPRFGKKFIYRFTATKAFYILPPWNRLRMLSVFIATNQYFDYLVILTILMNCVFLAMPEAAAAETAEYVFLGIYTIEMIVKNIARGHILYRFTYLRDPWNWLDYIVIVSAYITIIIELANPGGGGAANLQGLRTFRVFRALKTVSIVPGLKTIVNALLRAFKLLFEVIMLTTFCLMVFALFGLQIYKGVLRQKCVLNLPTFEGTSSMSIEAQYNEWVKNTSNWFGDDGDYIVCGNATGSGQCPDNYTCLSDVGENPNFGYTNFDHFGWAMLSSFQLITLDFWEDCYNKVIRASGPFHVAFFVIVVFFGSFYLINLMLAVVAMAYEEEAVSTEAETQEQARHEKEKDPLKELANATKAAAKWRPGGKEKSDMGEEPGDDPNQQLNGKVPDGDVESGKLAANGQTLVKYGKGRKPMVKMPSKDSGYSVQSSQSGVSKEKDGDATSWDSIANKRADSGTGSLNHGLLGDLPALPSDKKRQNLIKQQSTDNISSSAIHLEKAVTEENIRAKKKKKVGPEIIMGEGDGYKPERKKGQLIDRNCPCCRGTGLYTFWMYIQNYVFLLASDPLFDLFITICIILNTFLMASEHHGQSIELTETQRISNYIFTAIFTFECCVKLISLSKFYFGNGWNVFDFIIVIASLVDLGLEDVDGLSVFRSFRLLRVFKLAKSWPTLKLLLSIILNTLGALGYLTIVLGIVIYIFAVIGLQLFSKSYTADVFGDDIPRWNFSDFYHSMLMVFRVLCGEWIEPLWDCMRAADELCMIVFLPTLVLGNFIVLNLFLALLLNAFASDSLDQEPNDEDNRLKLAFSRIRDLCCCCITCIKPKRSTSVGPNDKEEDGEPSTTDSGDKGKDAKSKGKAEDKIALTNGKEKDGKSTDPTKGKSDPAKGKSDPAKGKSDPAKGKSDPAKGKSDPAKSKADPAKSKSQANGQVTNKEDKPKDNVDAAFSTQREEFSSFNAAMKANANDSKAAKDEDNKDDKNDEEKDDVDDLALGDEASTIEKKKKRRMVEEEDEDEVKEIVVEDCFPQFLMKRCTCWEQFDNSSFGKTWFKFRKIMMTVIENKIFEGIILFLIGVSSLTLAFEDVNLYKNPDMGLALDWLNIIFCVLFGVEMLIKWVGMGFKRYYTQFWTLLDFCIVVVSIASIAAKAAGVDNISAFRSLRTLRAFRPLRAISRWQGMKIVVTALMQAIPALCNVLVVCMVFWLIFSIMGVQFFSGKFYKCVDADGNRLEDTVVQNRSVCEANKDYSWSNSNIHFDNVFSGYLALFQVATFEGWMEVMVDAVDSTEVDKQPSFEASKYAYLYFMGFIIFGAFFTLNLFIGVIIENFNALKKKYEGSYLDMFLTQGQRNYMNTLKKLANKKPQKTVKRPKNSLQAVFYDVSLSSKFDLSIIVFIFLNMIIMAVDHYKMSNLVSDVLDIMNIVFTTIFTMEAVVKIIGLRLHYFRQPWNVFDFIVVVLSVGGIILDQVLDSLIVSPTLLRVVRVFRIGRVLRLIKAAKGIRKLLFALIISLPALLNIGALLFLVMFIFAIIGMSSFSNVKIHSALDDTVNFQTFGNSFVLLLRLSTSAGWNDILEPLLVQPPDCDPDYIIRSDGSKVESTNGDCGTPWMAYFFMVSYIIVIFLIVINMYIAVILENFNQAHEQEEVGVTEDDFDEFYVVWERFDPLATQYIKFEQISTFVADLDPPLGVPKPNEIALVAFDLPIMEGDKIHCLDVLIALVKNVLGRVEETEEFKELRSQMEEKFEETFPTRVSNGKMSSTMQKKKEDVAAKTLQRAWRSFKTQKQLRNITKMAMNKSKDDDEKKARGGALSKLGERLTNALSTFFGGSSRPGSATSTRSVKSSDPGAGKAQVKNTLQMPSVGALYNNQKDESNKDVEL